MECTHAVRRAVLLALTVVFMSGSPANATTISLTVTSPDAASRSGEPVTSGVPISAADTAASVKWALFDGATPVRVQTKVLHGRKTPWLLLNFRSTVDPGASKNYQLISQIPVGFSGDSVRVTSVNGNTRYRIVTGPMQVEVARDTFNLFREVWVNPAGTFGNSSRVVAFSARDHIPMVMADGTVLLGKRPSAMVWESSGPLRATLRVDGFYASAATPTDTVLRYTTRMTFFAGQTYVDIEHVIRNSVRAIETYVKVKSARLETVNGSNGPFSTATRASRTGLPLWTDTPSGNSAFELIPYTMKVDGAVQQDSTINVDVNGGMVIADWAHHGTSMRFDFSAAGQMQSEKDNRISRYQSRLFALAPASWYSTLGAFGSENFGTYADEQTANALWNWARPNTTPSPNGNNYQACSDLHALPRPDTTYAPSWVNINPANDMEADELWSNLMMLARVQQRVYLDRADRWARYMKYECAWRTDRFHYQDDSYWAGPNKLFRSPIAYRGGIYSFADTAFFIKKTAHPNEANSYAGGRLEGTHAWNAGLLDYYYITGDPDALDAAIDVAEQTRLYVIWRPVTDMGGSNVRADARNYLNALRVYEANSEPFWGTAAGLAQQRLMQASCYDARGFYGQPTSTLSGTIPARFPGGIYFSPFQLGVVVQALYRGWVVTGNDTLRQRLVNMAGFAYNYGANPDSMYTGDDAVMDYPAVGQVAHRSFSNFRFGTLPWASYSASSNSFIDALTIGYRLDSTKLCYLTRARTLWEHVSKYDFFDRYADANHMGRFQNSLQCAGTQNLLIYRDQGGDLTNGQLFFHDAIAASYDYTPPTATTDLGVVTGQTTAIVSWTAPGDDGAGGPSAAQYDLRYSPSIITLANFAQATPLATGAPQVPGTPECISVSGLTGCNIDYYFALRTRDECGWSGMSNVPHSLTKCSGGEVVCSQGIRTQQDPEAAGDLPKVVEFALRGRNPLAGPAAIGLGIPANRAGQRLEVAVYDVAGRRVRLLADGPARVGRTVIMWDLRDSGGGAVRSGAFYLSMRLGGEQRVKKLVLVQ